MLVTQVHQVTSENQFHCTELYKFLILLSSDLVNEKDILGATHETVDVVDIVVVEN